MAIGLIVIGDEIMAGKYPDAHFAQVVALLKERGLNLTWARYLGDDSKRITALLKETFASDDIVFCCGGIGSTPDDHTRQCAAQALNLPLVMHPEAKIHIYKRLQELAKDGVIDETTPDNVRRLQMGEFPKGSSIIPNPVNHFPGFSYGRHYFVPGFPKMAKGMIAYALDRYHKDLFFKQAYAEKGLIVYGLMEAKVTPLLETVESTFNDVHIYSLPHMEENPQNNYVELGVKGHPSNVEDAFQYLLEAIVSQGYSFKLLESESNNLSVV